MVHQSTMSSHVRPRKRSYTATRAPSEAKGCSVFWPPFIDAKATIARHIEMAELWIQDVFERREFDLLKISCEHSSADVLSKPVSQATFWRWKFEDA